jgi:hypothetical protein
MIEICIVIIYKYWNMHDWNCLEWHLNANNNCLEAVFEYSVNDLLHIINQIVHTHSICDTLSVYVLNTRWGVMLMFQLALCSWLSQADCFNLTVVVGTKLLSYIITILISTLDKVHPGIIYYSVISRAIHVIIIFLVLCVCTCVVLCILISVVWTCVVLCGVASTAVLCVVSVVVLLLVCCYEHEGQ